uniref:Uncharacterized protein n=1 Tax=Oryza brachyantha TaxID=4533 RepID=J3MK07_ORYBR
MTMLRTPAERNDDNRAKVVHGSGGVEKTAMARGSGGKARASMATRRRWRGGGEGAGADSDGNGRRGKEGGGGDSGAHRKRGVGEEEAEVVTTFTLSVVKNLRKNTQTHTSPIMEVSEKISSKVKKIKEVDVLESGQVDRRDYHKLYLTQHTSPIMEVSEKISSKVKKIKEVDVLESAQNTSPIMEVSEKISSKVKKIKEVVVLESRQRFFLKRYLVQRNAFSMIFFSSISGGEQGLLLTTSYTTYKPDHGRLWKHIIKGGQQHTSPIMEVSEKISSKVKKIKEVDVLESTQHTSPFMEVSEKILSKVKKIRFLDSQNEYEVVLP